MFEGYLYDCKTKRIALEHALKVYGADASRLVISQLEDKYKLIISGSTPCSSVADIEAAVFDLAGPSADLIIARLHAFLRAASVKPSATDAH